MGPSSESIEFRIDDSPALAAQKRINLGQEATEKRIVDSMGRLDAATKRSGDITVGVFERSKGAMDRMLSSVEKQANLAGKTGIDRLNAQYDMMYKKLLSIGGTSREIDRLTESFKKLKAAEEANSPRANPGKSLFLGLRNLAEGRDAYSALSFGKMIGELPMLAKGLGVVAGTLTILEAAGLSATKSLAEYGVEVRDVEIKTGLTAKQVGQFGFAAKAVGSDISVFERGMRGLTAALEDNSSAGDKAREVLKGVSLRDVSGELKPTAEIFTAIAEKINSLPNVFERNKAGMAIFKKGWLELAPVMAELAENLRIAKENGFGPTDSDVTKFVHYNEKLAEADALWSKVYKTLKAGIAGTVWVNIKATGAKWILSFLGANFKGGGSAFSEADDMNGPGGSSHTPSRQQVMSYMLDATKGSMAAGSDLSKHLASIGGMENAQHELAKSKERYDEARNKEFSLSQEKLIRPEVAAAARKATDDARRDYERRESLVKEMSKDEARILSNKERIRDLQQQGLPAYTIGEGAQQKVIAGLDNVQPFPKRTTIPSLFGTGSQNTITANTEYREGMQRDAYGNSIFVSPESSRRDLTGAALDARMKGIDARSMMEQSIGKSGVEAIASAQIKMLEMGADERGEIQTVMQIASVRRQALQYEEDAARFREGSLQNEIDATVKIAEIRKRQADEVKKETEGLLHTLFTRPSSFGSQLGGALRDASLKPIESGIADAIKGPIDQIIHGKDGTGGIVGFWRGLFGGNKTENPAVTTATNTGNTVNRLDKIIALMGGGGAGAPASSSGMIRRPSFAAGALGLGLGLGGMFTTPPFLSAAQAESAASGGGSSVAGLGRLSSGLWDRTGALASPAIGMTDMNGLPLSATPPFVAGSIPGVSGGAGSSGGALGQLGNFAGLGGMWKNFKGGLNSLGNLGGGFSSAHGGMNGAGGGAMLLGGGILAADGLRRGGWAGVGETTAGGALIGMKFGGPLGAAIGAAAGFTAGMIRMAFKTRAEQVQEQVKELYGININKQYALQIDQIAKSAFGGSISTAIRSPQVMDMLSLYSQATGQKFMFSNQPRPAYLTQSGGALTQQATYVGGQAYSYASQAGIGTYGGVATQTLPQYNMGQTTNSVGGQVYGGISLQLDGPATTALLRGEIASSPQEVAQGYSTAQKNSFDRRQNAARVLNPSLVTS